MKSKNETVPPCAWCQYGVPRWSMDWCAASGAPVIVFGCAGDPCTCVHNMKKE